MNAFGQTFLSTFQKTDDLIIIWPKLWNKKDNHPITKWGYYVFSALKYLEMVNNFQIQALIKIFCYQIWTNVPMKWNHTPDKKLTSVNFIFRVSKDTVTTFLGRNVPVGAKCRFIGKKNQFVKFLHSTKFAPIY